MTDQVPNTPDLDTLPLLRAALGKREERFRRALAVIVEHLPRGAIPNARYEDVRSTLIDGMADAWQEAVPQALSAIAYADRDNFRMSESGTVENLAWKLRGDLDMSAFGGVVVVPRTEAKLRAALAKEWPDPIREVLARGPALMAELTQVAEAMEYLRARRVKRLPPGEGPPPPELPQATREAQAAVRTRMRELLADLRDKFAAMVTERVRKQAKLLERTCAKMAVRRAETAAQAKADREAGRPVSYREPDDMRQLRESASYLRQLGHHLVDYDPNTYATTRHPDGAERTARFAQFETERVFHLWTERNVEKLAPIVEAKGGVEITVHRAHASYEGVGSALRVDFPDGSHFGFTNAIEYAVSPLGMPFARFPARFHDAVLPDGTRIRGASEERVKKAFIPDPVEDEAEPEAAGPGGP